MKHLLLIWRNKSGTTAIEYACIAALISIVIFGSLVVIGGYVTAPLSSVATNLSHSAR